MNKSEKFLMLVQSALIVRYSRTQDYRNDIATDYVVIKMRDAIYASEHIPENLTHFQAARAFLDFHLSDAPKIPNQDMFAPSTTMWLQDWSDILGRLDSEKDDLTSASSESPTAPDSCGSVARDNASRAVMPHADPREL